MCLLLAGMSAVADPGAVAQPVFEAELATFRSTRADQPRLELHMQVPYASLQFVSREEGFRAGYVIGVSVYRADRSDRPDGLVMTRSWTRRLQVDAYGGTLDWQALDRSSYALEFPPGRYVVRMRVEDSVSNRATTHETVWEVRDLTPPNSVSDLLVVDEFDAGSGRYEANPGRLVTSDGRLALYYELYLNRPERVRMEYEVREAEPQARRRGILGFLFGRGEEPGATLYQVVQPMSLDAGTNPVHRHLPGERFGPGEFEVTVRVKLENGALIAERQTSFSIGWAGLEGVDDLDTAIAQLRYIAKEREIRAMLQAPTQEAKFRLFRDFWDRRDPSPGSHRNERMDEYYSRVGHAVREYGRGGWESDRGEVFIRFGRPDRVEDHSEAQGSRPHQVWYYHRMGRRFIFVEDSGDFRLMVPIWDERTRM